MKTPAGVQACPNSVLAPHRAALGLCGGQRKRLIRLEVSQRLPPSSCTSA